VNSITKKATKLKKKGAVIQAAIKKKQRPEDNVSLVFSSGFREGGIQRGGAENRRRFKQPRGVKTREIRKKNRLKKKKKKGGKKKKKKQKKKKKKKKKKNHI